MREREKLKQQSEKSPEKWSAVKQIRNRVTREMCNPSRDYYPRLIDTNIGNPKRSGKPAKHCWEERIIQ